MLNLTRREFLSDMSLLGGVLISGCAPSISGVLSPSIENDVTKRVRSLGEKAVRSGILTREEIIFASQNYKKLKPQQQEALVKQIKGHYEQGNDEFALLLYVFRINPDKGHKEARTVGRLPKAGLFLAYSQIRLLNTGYKNKSLGLEIEPQTFSDNYLVGLTALMGNEFRVTNKSSHPRQEDVWYKIPPQVSLTSLRLRELADKIAEHDKENKLGFKNLDPRYKGRNEANVTVAGLTDGKYENLEARTTGTHGIQVYRK